VGKVAIITGSSRGIGAHIALRLAEHGADVVINFVSSTQSAEATAEKARGYGVRAITVKGDVSKKADVIHLFDTTKKQFGRIDIVMSNSGIEHFGALDQITEEEIDKTFAINVKGQFFIAQESYKHMENYGRLILMSSLSAQRGFPRHAIYGATKAAIQGMVKSLAWDFGPRNITVNAVAPGGIKTDMWAQNAGQYIEGGDKMKDDVIDNMIGKWSPLNRVGYPEDIAGAIALIASHESQWLTGQTFHIGGGAFMV